MKKLLLSLSLLISFNAFSQWMQTSGPEGAFVNCLKRVKSEIWLGTISGIYVSQNEGMSWTKRPLINSDCIDILSEGDTILVLYAIPYVDFAQYFSANIYAITSFNGGATWSDTVLVEGGITYPPSLDARLVNVQSAIFYGGFFQSADWGLTWSSGARINGVHNINDLQQDNGVLLARTYLSTYSHFYSSDAANSWHLIDSTGIYHMLLSNNTVLATTTSFDSVQLYYHIIRSVNFGQTWDTVFHLPAGQGVNGLIKKTNALYVYSTPTGFISYDNGLSWQASNAGNSTMHLEIDVAGGNKLGAGTGGVYMYVPAQDTFYQTNTGVAGSLTQMLRANGNAIFTSNDEAVFRSTDGGGTWIDCQLPVHPLSDFVTKGDTVIILAQNYLMRSWNNGITWDSISFPFNASQLEMIGSRIYTAMGEHNYSDNFGLTWTSYPQLDTSLTHTCSPWNNEISGTIRAMAPYLFLVTDDGIIARYDPGTQQWTLSTCFSSPGASNGNHLTVLGNDIVMSGYDELLISRNMGLTWETDSLQGLPGILDTIWNTVEPLVIPRDIVMSNGLWIGDCGFYGVYVSSTAGHHWTPFFIGEPPFMARCLTVQNNVVFAGSWYDGVWRRLGPLGNITGTVYQDLNNNGIRDGGEPPMKQQLVKTIPGNFMATTDTGGHYTLITDAIGDTLRAVKPAPFASVKPDHYITSGNSSNRDFGIYFPPNIADLSVDLTNSNVYRPGFQTNLVLSATNNGSLDQVAQLQLTLDSSLQFLSATPSPSSVSGNVYAWTTPLLSFSEKHTVLIQVQTPANIFLLDTMVCTAHVNPVAGDTTPLNNTFTLTMPVVGSFDPNDKTCAQGNFVSPEQIANDEEMVFVVRFQNTGTYQADFVRVADTLSALFDMSTFRVIAQSHPMHWAMTEQRVVNFYFDNINLPYAFQNEPASHGFVKYGIRCKDGVKLGNALVNTAYIYFDFNPPIITNTTTTLVAYPFVTTSVNPSLMAIASQVKVYPNPANNYLVVDMGESFASGIKIAIFDVSGRLVYNQEASESKHAVPTDLLNSGLYLGRLLHADGTPIGQFKFSVSR